MAEKNVVGVRVKRARKASKPPVTQTDLVARLQLLGVELDQSGISKIEGGVRPVSDVEVVALSKALRVSAAWLLKETEELVFLPASIAVKTAKSTRGLSRR